MEPKKIHEEIHEEPKRDLLGTENGPARSKKTFSGNYKSSVTFFTVSGDAEHQKRPKFFFFPNFTRVNIWIVRTVYKIVAKRKAKFISSWTSTALRRKIFHFQFRSKMCVGRL